MSRERFATQRLGVAGGVNPHLEVPALVAGMTAGADSIDHGAAAARRDEQAVHRGAAPSTRGTLLRSFTFGHVRQLDAVASRLLINLVT